MIYTFIYPPLSLGLRVPGVEGISSKFRIYRCLNPLSGINFKKNKNMKETPELKVGDIVKLKSGGPEMTVVNVSGDKVECVWFNVDDEDYWRGPINTTLPAVVLE